MTRSVNGTVNKKRHKKILERAKGFRGRAKNCFRVAINRVDHGQQYAYRDRRARKREFRGLWIQRINAAARIHGLTYSRFIDGLRKAGVDLDRKVIADIAVREPEAFASLAQAAKEGLKRAA